MQKTARPLLLRATRPNFRRRCLPTRIPLSSSITSRRCLSNRHESYHDASHVGPDDSGLHFPDTLSIQSPFQIVIPIAEQQKDANAWVDALQPYLPPTIRRTIGPRVQELPVYPPPNTTQEISHWLDSSQREADLDILSYLGDDLDRWDIVSWIVRTVVEGYHSVNTVPEDILKDYRSRWPKNKPLSDITYAPLRAATAVLPPPTPYNLDHNLSFESDTRYQKTRLQKRAIGKIWQFLGSLTLKAATSTPEVSGRLMPYVLSTIATLHHYNVVPESVYNDSTAINVSAIQQPPMLYLLSSRILTALSDAAWAAQQASPALAARVPRSQYTFELPGTRYKSEVEDLRPEIWLELILWSCLHGGWVVEGANILKTMQSYTDTSSWSLISWNQARQDINPNAGSSRVKWTDLMDVLEGARPQISGSSSGDSDYIKRTISSELVSAYVDGLVNVVDVGVDEQPIPIAVVLSHLKGLRGLLDRSNLGLGYTTWDAIALRLVESEALPIEKNPGLALKALSLVRLYGEETSVSTLR